MNLGRTEDQAGLFGTIIFHALLVFLLMLTMTCQTEEIEDPLDGAVSVSIGEPDYGGPDNSTAETSEVQPQPTEANVDEQVTSEVDGAPEVQQTETSSTSTPTTTPDPPKDPAREVDERSTWKPGSGAGSGDGDQAGDQGQEDGDTDGQPDGTGGEGTQGTGFKGDGFYGNIGGFKVANAYKPVNNKQEFGKVTILVCVDKNGYVISAKKGGTPQTTASKHLERLSIDAARKFKFTRIGKATNRNCGYITFNYKAG